MSVRKVVREGRVTCELTISADGYSAGLNQTEERPFGDDGLQGGAVGDASARIPGAAAG
jgi:hypothetical protein